MLLAGLRQLLARAFPEALVREAASARAALDCILKEAWDLVLLDIDLPDRSGLDLLEDIRVAAPRLPVLVLSGQLETEYGLRALKAGARGFVSKSGKPDELMQAIQKVRARGRYVSPVLAERLARSRDMTEDRLPHEALSAREFQILGLIAAGKSVGEIASQLCLSVKTISTYRTRLLKKMGMTSNAELMRYAFRYGLSR